MKHKAATPVIESANEKQLGLLPFTDTTDFTDADRGFIGALEPCVISSADLIDALDHFVETLLGSQRRLPP